MTPTLQFAPLYPQSSLFQGLLFIKLEGQFIFTHKGKEYIFWVAISYAVYVKGRLLQDVRKGHCILKQIINLDGIYHVPGIALCNLYLLSPCSSQ